jgi:hypothetical protein
VASARKTAQRSPKPLSGLKPCRPAIAAELSDSTRRVATAGLQDHVVEFLHLGLGAIAVPPAHARYEHTLWVVHGTGDDVEESRCCKLVTTLSKAKEGLVEIRICILNEF